MIENSNYSLRRVDYRLHNTIRQSTTTHHKTTTLLLGTSHFVVLSSNYTLPAEKTLMDFVNHREAKIHHTFWFSSLRKKRRELETG